MSEKSRFFRRCPDLLSREVNGETILLHLSGYSYYGMNRAGSAVWRGLAHSTSVENLARHMGAEFAVDEATARRDIGIFLAELEGQGLIEAVLESGGAANAGPVLVENPRLHPYAPPQLEIGQLRNAADTESAIGSDGVETCCGHGHYFS